MGDELPVAATVQRLVRDGLSRHEAIPRRYVGAHALPHRDMRTQTEMDQEAYNLEIRELTEERWRAEFEDAAEDGA